MKRLALFALPILAFAATALAFGNAQYEVRVAATPTIMDQSTGSQHHTAIQIQNNGAASIDCELSYASRATTPPGVGDAGSDGGAFASTVGLMIVPKCATDANACVKKFALPAGAHLWCVALVQQSAGAATIVTELNE